MKVSPCMIHPILVVLLSLLLASSSEAFATLLPFATAATRGVGNKNGLFSSSPLVRKDASLFMQLPVPTATGNDVASVCDPADAQRSNLSSLLALRGGETPASKQPGFLERNPFLSACMITTLNAGTADLITQLFLVKGTGPRVWNAQRTMLFAAFGFLYQGCVQYIIVNQVWERLFPGTKPKAVFAKICAMNLLSDPLLFMPTFYIFKQFMVTGTMSWEIVKVALLAYKANALMDWRNSWMIWFPGHVVTYGVMPAHKRIPWIASLSFFYMCVLSLTRGGG